MAVNVLGVNKAPAPTCQGLTSYELFGTDVVTLYVYRMRWTAQDGLALPNATCCPNEGGKAKEEA